MNKLRRADTDKVEENRKTIKQQYWNVKINVERKAEEGQADRAETKLAVIQESMLTIMSRMLELQTENTKSRGILRTNGS